MKEMGKKTNILSSSSKRASIQKGLDTMKNEGWLSEKEHQDLSEKIAHQ
jgi:hypothetical protein